MLLFFHVCELMCVVLDFLLFFFFFKQKTAYEMRISDWSSDVCSSDLMRYEDAAADDFTPLSVSMPGPTGRYRETVLVPWVEALLPDRPETLRQWRRRFGVTERSEEHTSELQSLMRISYAVFCLKKKKKNTPTDEKDYQETTIEHMSTTKLCLSSQQV